MIREKDLFFKLVNIFENDSWKGFVFQPSKYLRKWFKENLLWFGFLFFSGNSFLNFLKGSFPNLAPYIKQI